MQTKHLCVSIHIWTKGEVGGLELVKPSSKIFLLTVPRRYIFCGSFMLFLSCICYAFACVCLLMPCGHLLGKGWPLGSRLWCLIVSLLLSHWYPGTGVVLDCIDSCSLPSFLLRIIFILGSEEDKTTLPPEDSVEQDETVEEKEEDEKMDKVILTVDILIKS